ncbi:MAG: endonuclease domain-containing protein [SAR324 cluster bacterium]|nr:endonuclease domain-containing protein [SAR324 cluster bacterium]
MPERKIYTSSRLWRKLKPQARAFRAEATPAETLLWEHLRMRRLEGVKFRRQHPIDRFVADFCGSEHKLVIELDGGIHESRHEEDSARQARFHELGFKVLRFANEEVIRDIEAVLAQIRNNLNRRKQLA